jgi:transposase-like protein
MTSIGRPARYSAEIAQRILDCLSSGHSLRAACRHTGISHAIVLEWVRQDRDGFAARYRAARQTGGGPTTCPTRYTAEIAERILQHLLEGRTLAEICGEADMPSTATVRQWVAEDRDGFAARYRRVREVAGNKAGRPTRYDDWVAGVIADELSRGRSLASVCTDPLMPAHATIRHWVAEDRDGFAARYEVAREAGCETLLGEIIRIADRRDCWIPLRKPDGKIELIFDRQYVKRAEARIKARLSLWSKMQPRIKSGRPRGPQNNQDR